MKLPWIAKAKKHLSQEPAFAYLIQQQPKVSLEAIQNVNLLESLTHAIINQQLSGKAADTIHARVLALFPKKRLHAKILFEMSDETLRQAGLSYNKIRFLKDLAKHVIEKRLPTPAVLHQLSDEELIKQLTAIHGIGPWTVHMLLIFKLGRPDVFPSADLGIQKGFQNLYRKRSRPTAKALDRFSQRWKPYRTLAAWYLWRASDEGVDFSPTRDAVLWKKTG